jgi:hypothetical protein
MNFQFDLYETHQRIYQNLLGIDEIFSLILSKFKQLIERSYSSMVVENKVIHELVSISNISESVISQLRKFAENLEKLNEQETFILDQENYRAKLKRILREVIDNTNIINSITHGSPQPISELIHDTMKTLKDLKMSSAS